MLDERFVIVGAIISFLGAVTYVISTLKGKTKPNRVSWFIWALAPMIAFSAELSKGVGIQSLLTFMVGFNPLLIFLASFVNKKAQWKLGKLDLICGSLAILGIIIWLLLKEGNAAIFFAILADGLAAIPTLVKSYKFPETENYFGFLTAVISSGLTLLTIDTWNFAHWGFPLYIFLTTIILVMLIKFKVGLKIQKRFA